MVPSIDEIDGNPDHYTVTESAVAEINAKNAERDRIREWWGQ
ncbi:hypothetical protein [Microbacterium sp. SORGH_AS_0888]|nr:hypothetical protein [Microbacterium sp. SORGH_AS_0888]MDQ1130250.1 hypothetical protein [Microbacterium sp. SORGH_AS_0888]